MVTCAWVTAASCRRIPVRGEFGSVSESPQRLIVSRRELGEKVVLVEREMLDERHGHDLLPGIDLAIRRRCAVPAELPDGRRDRELPQIGRHFHAETKPPLAR